MISYILHVGFILAGCLLFYKLLLEKETFYKVNRFVLLSCLVLSFALPLLPVPQHWSFRKAETGILMNTTRPSSYSNTSVAKEQQEISTITTESPMNDMAISSSKVITWFVYLYWFGVVTFGFNFLLQLIILLYRAYSNPVIKDGRFRIVEVNGNKAPCSFTNNIFINPEKYDWETYNQILLHEKVHVRQGHSFDILLAELVLIFQWFNPFAWLYRKELEKNLEFETDHRLLEHAGVEKESYQMNLLKVSAPHFPLSLTTNYNHSLLKKRLVMMNAKKSNVHTIWKYFFLLPVLALFVCFFNEPVVRAQNTSTNLKTKNTPAGLVLEGYWFATIQDDKVSIEFKRDGDNGNTFKSMFLLSEFKNLPGESAGNFSITREAGTITFTGRFEGQQGNGGYKFVTNEAFKRLMGGEGIDIKDEEEINFFLLGITHSYLMMLKEHGYAQLKKADLKNLAEQGVGKKGESNLGDEPMPPPLDEDEISTIINFKSVGVTEQYIKSFEDMGYKNIPPGTLVNFKSTGVTPLYIKSFEQIAYKNIPYDQIVNFMSAGVTPEYIKSFIDAGFKDLSYGTIINLKGVGVSPPKKEK